MLNRELTDIGYLVGRMLAIAESADQHRGKDTSHYCRVIDKVSDQPGLCLTDVLFSLVGSFPPWIEEANDEVFDLLEVEQIHDLERFTGSQKNLLRIGYQHQLGAFRAAGHEIDAE
jgi:hypothetical protein